MKVSIFGLGYVGAVSAACLARQGHKIIGVDIDDAKIDMMNSGQSPIVEELIDDLMREAVDQGALYATRDAAMAVAETDVSLISVGTPTAKNGVQDISAVVATVRAVGEEIKRSGKDHTVIIRSTIAPGSSQDLLAPALAEASARGPHEGVHLAFNPEFLREGSSVKDFENPPFTVSGAEHPGGHAAVRKLYEGINAPFFEVSLGVAESVKVFSNAYHALKIAFANEAGAILHSLDIDAREAMRIFCEDDQLNISKAYLRPGFAFGGSCLPKELRGISALAADQNVEAPVLNAVLPSNEVHIKRLVDRILDLPRGKIALFGLSFKPGTDDLRESPLVTLAERLIGKGYELAIVDDCVEVSRLMGKNKAFIEREIPHFQDLMQEDAKTALNGAGIVIFGHGSLTDKKAIAAALDGKTLFDLQGAPEFEGLDHGTVEGVCW